MSEYVVAYSTASLESVENACIVSESDVVDSAMSHAALSKRGVVYVYRHNPEAWKLRGALVAIATEREWYQA